MPTPTKGRRLGSGPAHQRLLLANLATALFEHGRITTTEAKAKRLRPLAERLVTFAKRGDLHARRQALTVVRDKGVIHTLFSEIGPRYETRNGGYTRITKIGPRKGDNAPMAVIELVEAAGPAETEESASSPGASVGGGRRGGARRPARARSRQPAAAGATAEETQADAAADTTAEETYEEAAEEAEEAAEETQQAEAAEQAEAEGEAEAEGSAEEGAEERTEDSGEDESKKD